MRVYLLILIGLLSGCKIGGSDSDTVVSGSSVIVQSNSVQSTVVTPEPASFWLLLFVLIVYGIFLWIKYPQFCKKCMAQGMGIHRGIMYEGECRCNPNGRMS